MTELTTKHIRLFELLEKLTEEGKQEWRFDEGKTEPVTQVSSFEVSVRRSNSSEGTAFIEIAVKNYSGEVVDKFTDDDMTEFLENDAEQNFKRMERLLRSATRRASGADNVLDEILVELEEKSDEVPF